MVTVASLPRARGYGIASIMPPLDITAKPCILTMHSGAMLTMDMARIEKCRLLDNDPMWQDIWYQLKDVIIAKKRVWTWEAWRQMKGMLCLKGAWCDFKGGKTAIFGVPSVVADKMWHELILKTSCYKLACKRILGCFVHHESVFDRKEERRLATNTIIAMHCVFNIVVASPLQSVQPTIRITRKRPASAMTSNNEAISSRNIGQNDDDDESSADMGNCA